jgi:hypothetical protein
VIVAVRLKVQYRQSSAGIDKFHGISRQTVAKTIFELAVLSEYKA